MTIEINTQTMLNAQEQSNSFNNNNQLSFALWLSSQPAVNLAVPEELDGELPEQHTGQATDVNKHFDVNPLSIDSADSDLHWIQQQLTGNVKTSVNTGSNSELVNTVNWSFTGSFQSQTHVDRQVFVFDSINSAKSHSSTTFESAIPKVASSTKAFTYVSGNINTFSLSALTNSALNSQKASSTNKVAETSMGMYFQATEMPSQKRIQITEHLNQKIVRVRDYFSANPNAIYSQLLNADDSTVSELVINGRTYKELG